MAVALYNSGGEEMPARRTEMLSQSSDYRQEEFK